MAIADVKEYTHLTEEEVEQLGNELDAIRAEIEESRGSSDAAYINRMIRIQLMENLIRAPQILRRHLHPRRLIVSLPGPQPRMLFELHDDAPQRLLFLRGIAAS